VPSRATVAGLSASDDCPTKICPDCAETVLAAARRCRYCGYRFDAGATPAPAASFGGVLGLLRRAHPPTTTVPDLMASWGIVPDPDEGHGTLCHGAIAGEPGFIVVTQTRFRFVPALLRSTPGSVREEHLLVDLLRVHSGRHRLRRALFIEWRDTRTVVELDAGQLSRLRDLLSPHALTAQPPGERR
jgi:hypothetical protein